MATKSLETFGTLLVEGQVLAESLPVWVDYSRRTRHWKGAIQMPTAMAPASGTIAHLTLADGREAEIAVEQSRAGTEGQVLVRFVGLGPLEKVAG